MSERLDALAQFFTTLSQENLSQLRDFYAADAFFKDPFNEVQKVADIEHIFSEMFVSLHAPKFVIHSQIAQGNEAFLIWDFHFRIKKYQPNLEQKIRGSSHLKFDEQGRVNYHRDYWDAAEELYEKLPLIGTIMRFMKRRVG
jgi:steroid Delta-isomerase